MNDNTLNNTGVKPIDDNLLHQIESSNTNASPLQSFLPKKFDKTLEDQAEKITEDTKTAFQTALETINKDIENAIESIKELSYVEKGITLIQKKDYQAHTLKVLQDVNKTIDERRVPALINAFYNRIFPLSFLKAHIIANTSSDMFNHFGARRREDEINGFLPEFATETEDKVTQNPLLVEIQNFARESAQIRDLLLSTQQALNEINTAIAPYPDLYKSFKDKAKEISDDLFNSFVGLNKKAVDLNMKIVEKIDELNKRNEIIDNANKTLISGNTQPTYYKDQILELKYNERLIQQMMTYQKESLIRTNTDTNPSKAVLSNILEKYHPNPTVNREESPPQQIDVVVSVPPTRTPLQIARDYHMQIVGLKEFMRIALLLKKALHVSPEEWQILSTLVRRELKELQQTKASVDTLKDHQISEKLIIQELEGEIAKINELRGKINESVKLLEYWADYDPNDTLAANVMRTVEVLYNTTYTLVSSLPSLIGLGGSQEVVSETTSNNELNNTASDTHAANDFLTGTNLEDTGNTEINAISTETGESVGGDWKSARVSRHLLETKDPLSLEG